MAARINLAPEVYQQRQHSKEMRRLTASIGTVVGAVAVGIVVLLLVLIGGQKVYLATVQSSINKDEAQLKTYSDLQDAATIAQHLDSISSLQGQRVYLSKFLTVLQNTVPQGIQITSLSIDSSNSITMNASARSYSMASKLAEALEKSNVEVGPNAQPSNQAYFTNVQLGSVGSSGQSGVDFKLTTQMSSEVTNGQ